MQQNLNKRTIYLVVFVLAFVVLLLVSFTLYRNAQNKGKYFVQLKAVPSDMIIEFNNQIVPKSFGKFYLEPGEYAIRGSKNGFESKTINVVVDDNKSDLTLLLSPVTEEAKDWVDRNKNLYLEAEASAGEQNQISGDAFRRENPILEKLPFNGGYYRIDYRMESEDIIIEIRAESSIGRRIAINKIFDWGYSPSNYHIDFIEFTNPFKENSDD